ncbi:MAG: hypothetical protein QM733_14405 [Ilumatobacteraceae bacterium]
MSLGAEGDVGAQFGVGPDEVHEVAWIEIAVGVDERHERRRRRGEAAPERGALAGIARLAQVGEAVDAQRVEELVGAVGRSVRHDDDPAHRTELVQHGAHPMDGLHHSGATVVARHDDGEAFVLRQGRPLDRADQPGTYDLDPDARQCRDRHGEQQQRSADGQAGRQLVRPGGPQLGDAHRDRADPGGPGQSRSVGEVLRDRHDGDARQRRCHGQQAYRAAGDLDLVGDSDAHELLGGRTDCRRRDDDGRRRPQHCPMERQTELAGADARADDCREVQVRHAEPGEEHHSSDLRGGDERGDVGTESAPRGHALQHEYHHQTARGDECDEEVAHCVAAPAPGRPPIGTAERKRHASREDLADQGRRCRDEERPIVDGDGGDAQPHDAPGEQDEAEAEPVLPGQQPSASRDGDRHGGRGRRDQRAGAETEADVRVDQGSRARADRESAKAGEQHALRAEASEPSDAAPRSALQVGDAQLQPEADDAGRRERAQEPGRRTASVRSEASADHACERRIAEDGDGGKPEKPSAALPAPAMARGVRQGVRVCGVRAGSRRRGVRRGRRLRPGLGSAHEPSRAPGDACATAREPTRPTAATSP